jgi:hypothetical protein
MFVNLKSSMKNIFTTKRTLKNGDIGKTFITPETINIHCS